MTAAARALGYTPSAISQQISKLERDVRQVLVEQNGRVATLSPAGRVVAEAAGRILGEIEQMQAQLENERKTVAGTLTLAAFATATRGVIPPALRRLRSDWPRLKCHLVEADSHHAMALVEDGSVDIAIVHDWLEMPLVLSTGLSRLGSPRPAHSVLHGDPAVRAWSRGVRQPDRHGRGGPRRRPGAQDGSRSRAGHRPRAARRTGSDPPGLRGLAGHHRNASSRAGGGAGPRGVVLGLGRPGRSRPGRGCRHAGAVPGLAAAGAQ
jgi:DNA-binding transcriptional LysR family regulator